MWVGGPPAEYFSVPAGYVERMPSEQMERYSERLGGERPFCVQETVERPDARRLEQRTQSGGERYQRRRTGSEGVPPSASNQVSRRGEAAMRGRGTGGKWPGRVIAALCGGFVLLVRGAGGGPRR